MSFESSKFSFETDYNTGNSGLRHFRMRYEGDISQVAITNTSKSNAKSLYAALSNVNAKTGDTYQLYCTVAGASGASGGTFNGAPATDPLVPADQYYQGFLEVNGDDASNADDKETVFLRAVLVKDQTLQINF